MVDLNSITTFLMKSITKPTISEGTIHEVYDPEEIRYRLYDVAADNFPAFVREYKDVLTMCNHIEKTMFPPFAQSFVGTVREIAENAMVSVSAESGHNGKLMSQLLANKTESKIILDDGKAKSGVIQRMRGITEPNGNEQQQQQ